MPVKLLAADENLSVNSPRATCITKFSIALTASNFDDFFPTPPGGLLDVSGHFSTFYLHKLIEF